MLTGSEKEDRSNGTRPPDVKANRVAPDRNNNNNIDSNMLDSSSSSADDDDEMMPEWHYIMSDEDYDSYYHNTITTVCSYSTIILPLPTSTQSGPCTNHSISL
mmetsp:Transcript_27149/g.30495  ORF Transcript_27149/g.30495 Transcript_27149/m.30495 type:complete len:103 (-) Transcript_27149:1971-2279(-)|eukprot:CAMPEP_0170962946 /NCGR_PEP_ID=MMETSP0735-20130129/39243_1 /TAXON_ID=186038 /ORGANISM="Fragilariopsis kerguelensis, Strain L26-C5" /LENGTH=102 /DNA_ID=CAMNT_0011379437 /DNA_START=734 /DNA_END=1042 /DNA_ORIENTATION=-